jgi:hypothetical protein
VTYEQAVMLVKAEREKRKGRELDMTTHDWQAIGHRIIDHDTHRPRLDAFLKGQASG